jgi:phage anti-repressor protein
MIQIKEHNGEQLVDARELHTFLGVGKVFRAWIQDRIEQYEFIEGRDYVVLEQRPKLDDITRGVGRPSKEYAITLDMAKELAMLERNEKGREARRYFIECEKKLKDLQQPMDELEMIAAMIKSQLEQRASMKALETSVSQLSDKVAMVEKLIHIEEEFVTVSGFLSLIGLKNKTPNEIRILGMQVSKHCKENGIQIAQVSSAKYGKVNAYPREVLQTLIGELE